MGQAQGSNTRVMILNESSWGQLATANNTNHKALVIPFVSEGLRYSRSLVEDPTITAVRDYLKSGRGEVDVAGDINVRLNYNAHAELIRHVFGGTTANGGYAVFPVYELQLGAGEAGTFQGGEAVSGAPSGATGVVRAIDTTNDKLYVAVTSGTFAASDTVTGATSGGSGTVSTATATSAYAHRFRIADPTDVIGLTVEKMFKFASNDYAFHRYLGCRINQWDLNFEASGLVESTFGFMGKIEEVVTGTDEWTNSIATAQANADDLLHKAFDNFDILVVDEAGSTLIGTATELRFTVNNNLDGGVRAIGGQGARADLPVGKCKVSGSVTVRFDSETMYQKALNHQDTSLRVLLDRTGTAWTGYGQVDGEQMELVLPKLVFNPAAPTIEGPQGITAALDFEAFYEVGQAETTLECWVVNQQDDYTAKYAG